VAPRAAGWGIGNDQTFRAGSPNSLSPRTANATANSGKVCEAARNKRVDGIHHERGDNRTALSIAIGKQRCRDVAGDRGNHLDGGQDTTSRAFMPWSMA